jgi:hypothetical protein
VTRLAWTIYGITLALIPVAIVLGSIGVARGIELTDGRGSPLTLPLIAGGAAALAGTIGLLVATRQPGNAIGWIFSACGLGYATISVAFTYADLSIVGRENLPAGTWCAWIASWLLIPTLFFAPSFVALLFPDGRPPSASWRPVYWAVGLFAAVALVASALDDGDLDAYEGTANPAGISGPGRDVVVAFNGLGERLVAPLMFLTVLCSLVVRFRRSRGIERQQMKWLFFAGTVIVGAFIVSFVVEPLVGSSWITDAAFLVGAVAVLLLPVAVAIAILRYRLYEIDRLISRTLVYAALSLVLGAAYVGLVLGGQALFSSFAGGSNLAIAASTLVVAALFLPVRSRVQRFVDRRFYRRRYDAQRTLEGFGTRLREQVDLGALEQDLHAVMTETMQPAHASLWLREAQS